MNSIFVIIGVLLGLLISPFVFTLLFILYGYIRLLIFSISVKATITHTKPYLRGKQRIFAEWKDPKTNRIYRFSTPIAKPDTYPVGSSIPVVFDPKKPNWRLMAFFEELPLSVIRVHATLPF